MLLLLHCWDNGLAGCGIAEGLLLLLLHVRVADLLRPGDGWLARTASLQVHGPAQHLLLRHGGGGGQGGGLLRILVRAADHGDLGQLGARGLACF